MRANLMVAVLAIVLLSGLLSLNGLTVVGLGWICQAEYGVAPSKHVKSVSQCQIVN